MHDTAKDIKLDWMRPWEVTKMLIKRHWIVFIKIIWIFISGLIVTAASYSFWTSRYIDLIMVVFWMIWSMFIYIEWLNHELDLYIITNNRIIWVDQVSFLNRKVSECNLWQVQEVWNQTKWFWANILNYWTVKIQTAWNATNFIMDLCPRPIEHSREILNEVDHYRDTHGKWKWEV